MVINNVIQGINSIYAASNNVKRTVQSAENKTTEARDEIQLSSEAQSFSSILSKVQANQGQVRKDKVAYYESLISSGNYHVDSKAIADKMLKSRF